MAILELGPIIPTRENTIAMVKMRQAAVDHTPQSRLLRDDPVINSPDIQYEALRYRPEDFVGAFRAHELLAFIETGDWLWGHQLAFEQEIDIFSDPNSERGALFDDPTLRLRGNPLGVKALLANEVKVAGHEGAQEAFGQLLDHTVERAGHREIRLPLIAASRLDDGAHIDTDPARLAALSRGFESTTKRGLIGRLAYELFVRAPQ